MLLMRPASAWLAPVAPAAGGGASLIGADPSLNQRVGRAVAVAAPWPAVAVADSALVAWPLRVKVNVPAVAPETVRVCPSATPPPPRALLFSSCSTPWLTKVVPRYELAPPRASSPLPRRVKPDPLA